ncbi:exonuclease III [endosymbiont of Euscepes postfasciatus]|uniref:exodeoxyribonuclease III n=1 Tax=endosymbiont of Euscepes postfasciatus TaxID=650377 RepID=UPI000DC73997|nr:exodeoxyribonuclease III [endosymbiont of Euscepes postfasciatus]BBA84724.1 exonuclease III [endosymbiont of Euscepes postfasciatus]
MKIISFNINGIRSNIKQLENIIYLYDPDIIGLQETKISNNLFPIKYFNKYGYNNIYCNGNKNHFGVALISKIKPNNIYYNFLNSDTDFKYRIIIGEFYIKNKYLLIINIYVPQGDNIKNKIKFNYKLSFLNKFIHYVKSIINCKNLYILIIGDMNILNKKIDIGIENKILVKMIKNKICPFTLLEKKIFIKILNCGLIDIYRNKYFKCKKFTWFSFKNNNFIENKGLRIDYMFSNKILFDLCDYIDIKYEIKFSKKTSDHIPILSKFLI